jgi:hypothetical protein
MSPEALAQFTLVLLGVTLVWLLSYLRQAL